MPDEFLEINNVDLNDLDAGWIGDLGPLHGSAARRGLVEELPYMNGGIIYPHRDTFTELVFDLHIPGEDWSDHETNEEYIRSNVVGSSPVLGVEAIWHRNSGDLWSAEVVVKGMFDPVLENDFPPLMQYSLTISVNGWFTYLSGS